MFSRPKMFLSNYRLKSTFLAKCERKNLQKNKCCIKNVAIESMKKVADEEVAAVDSADITVSGDGTWKTRGHTSQIGVCTVIGAKTGKIIDVDVLSKACKDCSL
ncbi:hypothetical protein AVEN_180933-1 [Araneus ventricosus]|uniref:Mutator-like transposase domain-containing protein n=1 Tax=Araneus ventricosus TaxID=182803 RepID=A0A4Y2FKN9_ARAVE|nr:hypothetical protein AVEN_180933-1 [Araneus ventricosus]